jgi:hypothetical protein
MIVSIQHSAFSIQHSAFSIRIPSAAQSTRIGALTAPMTSGSVAGTSKSWRQIQLAIMKFCTCYPLPGIIMHGCHALISA